MPAVPVKIVIAPDSFKESLSATQVAQEIEAGFREIFPSAVCIRLPMADGGEGTVNALVAATGGRIAEVKVAGPLGEPVTARYGLSGDGRSAFLELAAASGLSLVPRHLRNPLKTTTFGFGELIRAALDAGARHLILGIGGSATNDGGAGMIQALGARLLSAEGEGIGFGGEALERLEAIDLSGLDPRLRECVIEVACDVDNPLTGPCGASAVYGPQKGATLEMVARLDGALERYAALIEQDFGVQVAALSGAGAAGGTGAALVAFCVARLRPGIDIVMEATGLESAVRDADLVITGEGRIDGQTLRGKVPLGVARVAKRHGKPVIALAGSLSSEASALHAHGIDALFSILPGVCSLDAALAGAAENIRATARNIAAVLKLAHF